MVLASYGLSSFPSTRLLQDAGSQDTAGKALETMGPARTMAKCRSTLDELLDTLKLLEEEPEPLPRPRAYHKDRYAWTDEVTAGPSLPPGLGPGAGPAGLRKTQGPLPAFLGAQRRAGWAPSRPVAY